MAIHTLKDFEEKLQAAINTPNMKNFMNLLSPGKSDCPFPSLFKDTYDGKGEYCPECPLSDRNGPRELIRTQVTCLVGWMFNICWRYSHEKITEEECLPELVLSGIKLLTYLEYRDKS